jgi:hypothetical protein
MNEVVSFHGNAAALTTGGRLNIRAIVKHFTQPFEATGPFSDVIEVLKINYTPEVQHCRNRGPGAAIAIRKAIAGRLDAISDARDRLSVAMLAPDEEDVRQILAAMLLAFHAQPATTSGFFIDVMVLELREPETGQPFSLPAVAAAARELWQTLIAPPSIAEFLPCVRKHQQRIEAVLRQLGNILEAADWADDLIKPGKPPLWDEDDPDFIPF